MKTNMKKKQKLYDHRRVPQSHGHTISKLIKANTSINEDVSILISSYIVLNLAVTRDKECPRSR